MGKVVVVTGPTASGKTSLAVRLAKALESDVVSADSMQVYRELDIGTAKPTTAETLGVPHHMIDVAAAGESFSVSQYIQQAAPILDGLLAQGKTPVICGGTGLYINALISGKDFQGSGAVSGVREALNRRWDAQGAGEMFAYLTRVDPRSAAKLHPNDKKRIIRAIEVFEQTGTPISAHNDRENEKSPRYDALMIGLLPEPRAYLYERINLRVEQMFELGLEHEARRLYDAGMLTGTAAQAIGYKELIAYFERRMTLQETKQLIQQKTRNYAKRQLTWFRADARIFWIKYEKTGFTENIFEKSTEFLRAHSIKL